MDSSGVLLWIVFASSLAGLVIIARLGPRRRAVRGWVFVYALLLVASVTAWWTAPRTIAPPLAVMWVLLVLLPTLGQRWQSRLLEQQRYAAATRLAWALAVLHPADGWWRRPRLMRAIALSHAGRLAEASALLDGIRQGGGADAFAAEAYALRTAGRWQALAELPVTTGWAAAVASDPSLPLLPLRALGELGQRRELVRRASALAPHLDRPGAARLRDLLWLTVFSFSGRRAAVERLFASRLAAWPAYLKRFWLATADAAAGDLEAAAHELQALLADPTLPGRSLVEARLADEPLVREPLAPEEVRIVDELERAFDEEERYSLTRRGRRPLATWALAAASGAAFLLELASGGSTSTETLLSLGALHAQAFASGQAWRAAAALFLHYGPLHLAMNVGGLLLLGPFLERALGAGRYVLLYLGSGVLANLLWLLLAASGATQDGLLVGASGCIMGIVGGSAAVLLRGWVRERAHVAARGLAGMLALVALQSAFDLVTPEISFTVHAGGLLSGLLLGLLLSHRSTRAPTDAPRVPASASAPASPSSSRAHDAPVRPAH